MATAADAQRAQGHGWVDPSGELVDKALKWQRTFSTFVHSRSDFQHEYVQSEQTGHDSPVKRSAKTNNYGLPALYKKNGAERRSFSIGSTHEAMSALTTFNSDSVDEAQVMSSADITHFDFSKIDYELDGAKLIGTGLWSSVYLVTTVTQSGSTVTAPPSPVLAVKTHGRPDAKDVFLAEARILTKLQIEQNANHHIVAFHGLDPRKNSLVFEGVLEGSLEGLVSSHKVMTEVERHLELHRVFMRLAFDLVDGLKFIHAAGVVHADIKPANILLDTVNKGEDKERKRARYIDFSASFVAGEDSTANAGGTWDYMAPEQLSIRKDLSDPTYSSDVWSLGMTLLFTVLGDSPYASVVGANMIMRREAIKTCDPMMFAKNDPILKERLTASQDFVDCCRMALQKDRERRLTADEWAQTFEA